MSKELITPIDEHSAKAIAEASQFGGKLVDASTSAGRYLGWTLGDLPNNLVGLLGDQVQHWRRIRAHELDADLKRRLESRQSQGVEPSPALALPILAAAIDETRVELLDLWQRLLANAFDPNRRDAVRGSFVELLKQFDPMDARVFQLIAKTPTNLITPNARDFVMAETKAPIEEVLVSFENLTTLGCLNVTNRDAWNPGLTNRGKLLFKALEP